MTIRLTIEKATDLRKVCKALLHVTKPQSIRELAGVIGKIVASFPVVMYALLHYRELENDKIRAFKDAKGDFDTIMQLSDGARTEIQWLASSAEN